MPGLADAWDDDALHGDWLLQKWAQWSWHSPDKIRQFPSSSTFAIKDRPGPEPISDAFALQIDRAVRDCPISTRNVLISAYLRREFNAFSDSILIVCVKEFLHEFTRHNP